MTIFTANKALHSLEASIRLAALTSEMAGLPTSVTYIRLTSLSLRPIVRLATLVSEMAGLPTSVTDTSYVV